MDETQAEMKAGAGGTESPRSTGEGPKAAVLPAELAILPMKSTVIFPATVMPVTVGRERSLRVLDSEAAAGRWIGFLAQKDPANEEPGPDDLHAVGTAATIIRMARLPDGSARTQVQGMQRFRVRRYVQEEPFLRAEVEPVEDVVEDAAEVEALRRSTLDLFLRLVSQDEAPSAEVQSVLGSLESPERLADFVAASIPASFAEKQALLESATVDQRLRRLVEILNRELRVQEIGAKIQRAAKAEMDRKGHEAFLREQLKAIQDQLGERGDQEKIVSELDAKIVAAGMPAEVEKVARGELDRLRAMSPGAAEYTVSRTYIEWLVALPWIASTPDTLDLAEARRILDEDHFGLEKVKDRILEFLAVVKLKGEVKGSILCFVGPPGVGKTSLGRSIARAMGRKFGRLALGGVRDEAEIRGHRRTYVGALPGRIIQELRKVGTHNPVFVLDELDKLGADYRGDPSSALLEVLDPEQNWSFSDHYLDVPFDLSRILFIATANVLDTIPAPLRDRTEIIHIPGYTEEEKLAIARRHLVPKVLEQAGLKPEQASFTDGALLAVIRDYTRENGLRNLERSIGTMARKIARQVAEGALTGAKVDAGDVVRYLGPRRFHSEVADRTSDPGVATGLAWTAAGGEILFVEATRMEGERGFRLTGQLGDVMKESAQIALSVLRNRATALGIPSDAFSKSEIHIHVPAGATPKDGPSAGVTMVVALASLLLGKPIRPDLAMTGEITLRGRVMPVGGIREKVLAAKRAGIRTILLPARNADDLEEVDAELRSQMSFHFVEDVDEVLQTALGVSTRTRPAPQPSLAADSRGLK